MRKAGSDSTYGARPAGAGTGCSKVESDPAFSTLDEVAPGRTVTLAGFRDVLDPSFREQLLAYGLSLRQPVKVLQQSPLTVILCDHVELALENTVARLIEIEADK